MEREGWVGRLRQLETKFRAGYKTVRAEGGGVFHRVARFALTDLPIALKAGPAPDGAMFRNNHLVALGKVIDHGGRFILEEDGEMVFPNPDAGDEIRVLSNKSFDF